MRTVLEGLRIPWCLWDYSGTFGVFSRPPEEEANLWEGVGRMTIASSPKEAKSMVEWQFKV